MDHPASLQLFFTVMIHLANIPGSKGFVLPLGILPSLITSSEHIVRTFLRHRRFIPEIKRFHQRSKVLAVHVRDELRLVLSRVTDFATAEDMLGDPKHSLWNNGAIREGLIQYLGSSYDIWIGISEQLSQELELVAKKCRALDAMESPDPSMIVCFPQLHNVPFSAGFLALLTS